MTRTQQLELQKTQNTQAKVQHTLEILNTQAKVQQHTQIHSILTLIIPTLIMTIKQDVQPPLQPVFKQLMQDMRGMKDMKGMPTLHLMDKRARIPSHQQLPMLLLT
jgi:hypothetical protein